MKVRELCEYLQAELVAPDGAADLELTGVGPIAEASAGQVTFVTSDDFQKYLSKTNASAVILAKQDPDCKAIQIIHKNPYWAFAKTAMKFYRAPEESLKVSERAFVAEDATIGKEVTIYPFVYVASGAVVEDGAVLYPNVFVGKNASVGKRTVIHASVVIEYNCHIGSDCIVHGGTVIGADGFGFAPGEGEIAKIPQTGGVVIEDNVEIGSNCGIDRGAMTDTRIRKGSKLDNQCQVAHNSEVGENCMLCGNSGLAGSAKTGNGVVLGAKSGLSNGVTVGNGVQLGAMSAIMADIPEDGGQYAGYPASPLREWVRAQGHIRRLPKLGRRVKELEEKIAKLMNDKAST